MAHVPQRIGVGLISAGWMGTVHSRGYREVAEKYPDFDVMADLVIVADPVARNAERLATRAGYRQITDDYRTVLEHPDVDVVSICAPNYLHHEFALAAADVGKPFWIEKPMGITVGQSREIAQAAERAGIVTAVGFNYRNAPAVEYARSVVRDGRLGRIADVAIRLVADYSAPPEGPRTWRFVRERAGSGVLGDLLSHAFDLAQWIVGPLAEVAAVTRTVIAQRPAPSLDGVGHQVRADVNAPALAVENEDVAAVLARFASGPIASFTSSRIAVGSRCDYALEIRGTEGALRWNYERMNELEICLPGDVYGYTRVMADSGFGDFDRFQPGAGNSMGFDDLKVIEAARFLRSVSTGEQLSPSVADGLAAAEVVAAAEASATDGAWHRIPAPTGRTTFDR